MFYSCAFHVHDGMARFIEMFGYHSVFSSPVLALGGILAGVRVIMSDVERVAIEALL